MQTSNVTLAVCAAVLILSGCASTTDQDGTNATAETQHIERQPLAVFISKLKTVEFVQLTELDANSVKVSFPSITAFAFDGAGISHAQQQLLTIVAEHLRDESYSKVVILGHTDSYGQREYNLRLSEQRAQQVKTFLQHAGLSADKLHSEGRGPAEPIADNRTEQGRAANRRVEIIVAI